MTSEFGSGFIVCLLQFTFHEPRIDEYDRDYARMRLKAPDLFAPAHAMEMWADGAVDHLRELKKPPKVGKSHWSTATRIRDDMIAWKWGTRSWPGEPEISDLMTPEAAHAAVGDARDIIVSLGGERLLAGDPKLIGAIVMDHELGLKHVDIGDAATCTAPIPSLRG